MRPSDIRSSTPILDLEADLPTKRQGRLTVTQVFIALGALGVGSVIVWFVAETSAWSALLNKINEPLRAQGEATIIAPILVPLGVLFFWFVSVAVHEAGHIAAGLMVGFSFSSVSVVLVSLEKTATGFAFRWHRSTPLDGLAFMRLDRLCRLSRRFRVFAAGGPVASLVAGLVAWAAWAWLPLGRHPSISFAIGTFLFCSAITFVSTIIPYRYAGYDSDGKVLLDLSRSLTQTKYWLATNALAIQAQAKVRPRSRNARWASVAGASHEVSRNTLAGAWLAYLSTYDRQDFSAAAEYLEKCLANAAIAEPPLVRVLCMEAGMMNAWAKGDAGKAAYWYRRASMHSMPHLLLIRSQVAMEACRCNLDGALLLWQEGLEVIEAMPPSPSRDQMAESWKEWRLRLFERRRSLYGLRMA